MTGYFVGASSARPLSSAIMGIFWAVNDRPYILKEESILDKSRAN